MEAVGAVVEVGAETDLEAEIMAAITEVAVAAADSTTAYHQWAATLPSILNLHPDRLILATFIRHSSRIHGTTSKLSSGCRISNLSSVDDLKRRSKGQSKKNIQMPLKNNPLPMSAQTPEGST